MNDFDAFENELRALKPAMPEQIAERLRQARLSVDLKSAPATSVRRHFFFRWYWWLAPAAAVVIASFFIWSGYHTPASTGHQAASPDTANAITAAGSGGVEVASELVSDFESVTQLESGEPVRFRYLAYVDNVTVEDPRSGVKWQQRSPRVEIVPVRLEVY